MEGDSALNGLLPQTHAEIQETFQFLTPFFDKSLHLPPNPKSPKQRRLAGGGKHDVPDQHAPGMSP